jgi:hypothetical protein
LDTRAAVSGKALFSSEKPGCKARRLTKRVTARKLKQREFRGRLAMRSIG